MCVFRRRHTHTLYTARPVCICVRIPKHVHANKCIKCFVFVLFARLSLALEHVDHIHM